MPLRRLLSAGLFLAAVATAIGTPASLLSNEDSKLARPNGFLDEVGEKAGLFGAQDGTLEAFAYPLKLFRDLRFSFAIGDRIVPQAAITQRIVSTPSHVDLILTSDEFQVTERLFVPRNEAGGLITLDVHSYSPLSIHISLVPDFQLMWPASFGSSFASWSKERHKFLLGADGQPYAAVLSGSQLQPEVLAGTTNPGAVGFSLGTIEGKGTRTIAFAASTKSLDAALQTENTLLTQAKKLEEESTAFYNRYLQNTVSIEVPDPNLQRAYDYSRLSLVKEMVNNPLLGRGLVAGYGLSHDGYRPGYSWFFGRDSFWSSFALNSAGDWANSKAAIEFVAHYQRADGKMPHEISQSASLVPWAKDYPYLYASADATPLFITAVRDYVQASGDIDFARSMWEPVNRAMSFSRSTLAGSGFPKNYGVGHGWVEGGPLLPVETETYMAGCYVEALRSLAQLARWSGHNEDATRWQHEFEGKRTALNKLFWHAGTGDYAYALDLKSKQVVLPTILALVPEWWGLLDEKQAQSMAAHLSQEEHSSDWGVRIISANAELYNPSGYHYGSVWPLFTGWASLANYRAHRSASGWADLKANSFLSLDNPNGNVTEVLSGQTDTPLSTSTPHQTWSAAMVIAPLLRGVFGLDADSVARHVTLNPQLPPDWNDCALKGVRVSNETIDFAFHRDEERLTLTMDNHGEENVTLTLAPVYNPYALVSKASTETNIPPGRSTVTIEERRRFDLVIPVEPPEEGLGSSNLKMIGEEWRTGGKHLTLHLSGREGHHYELPLVGARYLAKVTGAERSGDRLLLNMARGDTGSYINQNIDIDLR